jgi:hypothetical protein
MDKPNPKAEGTERNNGSMKRAAYTSGSNEVDMTGRRHLDIFFQEREN